MRQVLSLFVAVVFALSLAGVAAAQGTQTAPSGSAPAAGGTQTDTPKPSAPSSSAPSGSTMPSGPASGTDTGKSATDPSKSVTGTGGAKSGMDKSAVGKDKAGARTAGARGPHKVMGEVTRVDAAKGSVTLKTDDGDLDLHFPPSALQGIKEGDRVEVQMAIRPAAGGAASKAGKAGKSTSSTDSGAAPAAKAGEQKPKTQ